MSELLVKCTARGVALSFEGRGGVVRLTREDVLGALAFGELPTLSYRLGLVKYVGDESSVGQLLCECEAMVAAVAHLLRWRLKAGYAEGLARLMVMEACNPEVCLACNGDGCGACRHTGYAGRRSVRAMADIAGISKTRFAEQWFERYDRWLYGRMMEAGHELRRHLREQCYDRAA